MEIACNTIYQDQIVLQLLSTEEKFDLIVVDGFLNECVLPIIGVQKVSFVYMLPNAPVPWILNAIDSPQAYDHYPFPGFIFTDEMNLFQRTINYFGILTTTIIRNGLIMAIVDRIYTERLGNVIKNPNSVLRLEEEYLSLAIVKATHGVMHGLPKSASFIEAGGLHCHPSEPLPDNLEKFVNDSGDDGFIVVSFGSILKVSKISNRIRKMFLNTFGRLRQRVIWKWENDASENLDIEIPLNVKLVSWLPQQDLLGHSKARLFITHAGPSSIEEALYHGVPLIALPVFTDQPWHAEKIHKDGTGIRLDWDNLSESILYDAIQEILNNPK